MSAYNAINGEPSSTNHRLLTDILRGEWGFDGAVVTDVGVMHNLVAHHKTQPDGPRAIKAELDAGVDVVSDPLKDEVQEAYRRGLLSEADLDRAIRNQLRVKFRLGLFDTKPRDVPPFESLACPKHRALALETARRSIVLLKNERGLLPLNRKRSKTIAVIGPNATYARSLLGNYNGTPLDPITPLAGLLRKVGDAVRVLYAQGCEPFARKSEGCSINERDRFAEALAAAERADVVIACIGLNPDMEGEIGDASNADAAGDKRGVELPAIQRELIDALVATGTPLVLVNISGSAVAIPEDKAGAVVQAFYPGECGGTAIADVLFGDFNPCGRLPLTFYRTTDDLPPFENYAMTNRTYRFFKGTPLYPFGHGLSYTTFSYADLKVRRGKNGEATASVTVTNTGKRAGEEVVQLYTSLPEATTRTPIRQLAAVGRVTLKPGQSKRVRLTLWPNSLQAVLEDGTATRAVGKAVIRVADLEASLTCAP